MSATDITQPLTPHHLVGCCCGRCSALREALCELSDEWPITVTKSDLDGPHFREMP